MPAVQRQRWRVSLRPEPKARRASSRDALIQPARRRVPHALKDLLRRHRRVSQCFQYRWRCLP